MKTIPFEYPVPEFRPVAGKVKIDAATMVAHAGRKCLQQSLGKGSEDLRRLFPIPARPNFVIL
jgi:hypothetical protein